MRRQDDWIEAGAIVRPHGVKGEVILDLARDLVDLVVEPLEIRITLGEDHERTLKVERARDHKARKIVKFEGVDSVDAAESLRLGRVWLTREQIGEPGEGRWFVQDILGLDVFTDEGERLGKLEEVMHMPANDVYVVRGEGGEILLPAIDDVIGEVNPEEGRMVVHLMEGLR
jgi:16S rRNA processing protein RimM